MVEEIKRRVLPFHFTTETRPQCIKTWEILAKCIKSFYFHRNSDGFSTSRKFHCLSSVKYDNFWGQKFDNLVSWSIIILRSNLTGLYTIEQRWKINEYHFKSKRIKWDRQSYRIWFKTKIENSLVCCMFINESAWN